MVMQHVDDTTNLFIDDDWVIDQSNKPKDRQHQLWCVLEERELLLSLTK